MYGSDRLSKSWSFISEESFTAAVAPMDISADSLEWAPNHPRESEDEGGVGAFSELLISDLQSDDDAEAPRPKKRSDGEERRRKAAQAQRKSSKASDSKRNRTVTFEQTWTDSEIPVVGRSSSAPPSIQILQERELDTARRRAVTAPNVFNHMLYGSLRTGPVADLFSKEYCGLAFSAAASGFMSPFLLYCFEPLLAVYLSFSDDQSEATLRFFTIPGVASVFIGALSDFYPMWSFHRKAYMLGGWILAYFMLMALVVIAVIDDQAGLLSSNVRTFHGGMMYVILSMAVSLGVSVASVAAFAFVVELSQREPIHERGGLVLQYTITQQVSSLAAYILGAVLMDFDEAQQRTTSVISMKMLLLLMAVIALVPIPAVLFKLEEEPRQMKVDSVDRSSMRHQLWNVIQQEAVWRIILFICCSVFLASFQFEFAIDAIQYWADVSADASRLAKIPTQCVFVIFLFVYKRELLNRDWVHMSVIALVWAVALQFAYGAPIVFGAARSPWFYVSVSSLNGASTALATLVTILPLVEITETCLEGTTTGLVTSFTVVIGSVISTFSDAVSSSSDSSFSDDALELDASSTRTRVFMFWLAQCALNLFALLPILYLLPRQKLDAQQMRTYGNYSRPAGFAIVLLLAALIVYSATVNLIALITTSPTV